VHFDGRRLRLKKLEIDGLVIINKKLVWDVP
jgi:hypothetical protein